MSGSGFSCDVDVVCDWICWRHVSSTNGLPDAAASCSHRVRGSISTTLGPSIGRGCEDVKVNDALHPCEGGMMNWLPRALPATGCDASCRMSASSRWPCSGVGDAVGRSSAGTARPKSRVNTANGLLPRLRFSVAETDSRYGLNSAESLTGSPLKSEYPD